MRSKAAIAGHPIHPALVAVPIGAMTVMLVADIVTLMTADPGWATAARYALTVGIVGALLAAVFGFIDYFGRPWAQNWEEHFEKGWEKPEN